MPNKQTIASKRYQEKAGMIAKSYKLDKTIVVRFASACAVAGISQRAQLQAMMTAFCDKVERNGEGIEDIQKRTNEFLERREAGLTPDYMTLRE